MDGAFNDIRFRASKMLISPEGHKIHYAICFGFKASNNEAEYKALIASLCPAREPQVLNMKIFNDSSW